MHYFIAVINYKVNTFSHTWECTFSYIWECTIRMCLLSLVLYIIIHIPFGNGFTVQKDIWDTRVRRIKIRTYSDPLITVQSRVKCLARILPYTHTYTAALLCLRLHSEKLSLLCITIRWETSYIPKLLSPNITSFNVEMLKNVYTEIQKNSYIMNSTELQTTLLWMIHIE